jgi:hypothetical protein
MRKLWGKRPVSPPRVENLVLRQRTFSIIEVIASSTTIILFLGAVLSIGTAKHTALWQLALVVWMCALVSALIGILFIQEKRLGRRLAYTVSLQHMHQVLHELRDAEAAILQRNAVQAEVMPHVVKVLSATAQVFSTIVGQECRACIKTVHYPTDTGLPVSAGPNLRELRTSTLARDERTGRLSDDTVAVHVDQNTAFELLFLDRPDWRWFFSNDLDHPPDGYKNSSWSPGKPKKYRATATWPIQKVSDVGDEHDTLGFLGVDCAVPGVFDERFDFYVGAAIADALYPLLKLMHIQKRGGDPSACPTVDGGISG